MDIDEFLDKLKEFDDQRSILYDKADMDAPSKITDKKKPAMKKKTPRERKAQRKTRKKI